MKEILKRFDQLERKFETEVGGLRAEVLSRMAELEMRVTTALLDAGPTTSPRPPAARAPPPGEERIDALVARIEALEAKVG
ncbi:MAG: hypothetical protein M5U28_19345 [Sandaracinaceae bacterium]|nr:hypothetical protein [Sandaracinaceae bacterium]